MSLPRNTIAPANSSVWNTSRVLNSEFSDSKTVFTERSLALEEQHFKNQIRRGTCRDSVRIVKTFQQRIADVRARNKRPPVVYERILKQASERSLSELAVALGITPDEVRMLFEAQEGEDFSQN